MRAGVLRLSPHTGLLLIPAFLFGLQLVFILRLARLHLSKPVVQKEGIAFSVISIEPDGSAGQIGANWGPQQFHAQREMRGALGFEDENEKPMHQGAIKRMRLQSWAAGKPSFTAEVDRIINYITEPQMNCSLDPDKSQALRDPKGHWLLCLEDWHLLTGKTGCVAYSFSMDNGDAEFLKTVLDLGCEVHKFDPSRSTSPGGDKDHTLAGIYSNIDVIRRHRAWPEWRAPRKRKQKKKGRMGSGAKTLADIMEILGHQKIDFLYADLLSAERRVLQNWAELGILRSVGNLTATVHMQWAGFEVPGTNEEVFRYWFSVLRGIHTAGFQLVHSSTEDKEKRVLKQTVKNARGSYTLSWVNTRY